MFGWGGFWDKSLSWFSKTLRLPSLYPGNFKVFKNALEQFVPNCPPKHAIISANLPYIIITFTFLFLPITPTIVIRALCNLCLIYVLWGCIIIEKNESEGTLQKDEKHWDKITYIFRSTSNNTDDYNNKYMKNKLYSVNNLPLHDNRKH